MRQTLEVLKKIVAQVELDITRNADHDPTSQKLEDSLRTSHQQNQRRVKFQLIDGDAGIESVYRCANDLWQENPDSIVKKDANGA